MILTRNFNSDEVVEKNELLISTYLFPNAAAILQSLQLHQDTYILCVTYADSSGGDTQLFITGTVKEDEKSKDCAARELAEESHHITKMKKIAKIKYATWYECYAKDLSFVSYPITTQTNFQKNKERFIKFIKRIFHKKSKSKQKKKVVCIVHGSFNDLENLLKNFKKFDPTQCPEHDNIVGLAILSVQDIEKAITMIVDDTTNKPILVNFKD
jgi:hypothetical protein